MLEKQNEGFNRLVVCLIRLDYLIIIQFKIRALLLKYTFLLNSKIGIKLKNFLRKKELQCTI